MSQQNGTMQRKEEVLIEALPYIQQFEGKTFVVKYGGAAMGDNLRDTFAQDVTLLKKIGIRIVLVHGGGKEITETASKLGIESQFHNGQRITTEPLRDVVQMVLAGKINKDIAAMINRFGGRAVGLSGVDGSTLNVLESSPVLGLVGEDVECDASLLSLLLDKDYMPVLSPLGVDKGGTIYNINADLAASEVASALHAEKLIYMSDVEGIVVDGLLINSISKSGAVQLIEAGQISGGMIPKVFTAFETVDAGVNKVHIIDGRISHALLLEIFTDRGVGTEFLKDPA
ncbi:MAG TPA: acetylglutamate kinase [Candidatus Kapabacteria bacterium]|nr:acetylglutamate kinase [Candidatus Kapabacteria bacterium]